MSRRRSEPPGRAGQYWGKAQRFAAGARQVRTAETKVVAACTAAINAVDAVCILDLGARNASANHAEALDVLKDVRLLDAGARRRVRKHFQVLLQMRHTAAYTAEAVSDRDAAQAVQHMDRLLEAIGPVAQEAGWDP